MKILYRDLLVQEDSRNYTIIDARHYKNFSFVTNAADVVSNYLITLLPFSLIL